jgi:hypothetical protein
MERINSEVQEIISLLQAKNRCLQRLLELCTKFIASWELPKESSETDTRARVAELARFQGRRESTFKGLELYDRRANEALASLPSESRTPYLIEETRRALLAKDRLVQAIIERDNEIMTRLKSEKGRVFEELTDARRGQNLVNKFKSTWVPGSGEGLDRKS